MARYQQKTILNFGNSVDVARWQQQRQWQQAGQISSKIGDMAFKYLEKEVGEQATIAGMMAGQSGKPSLKKGWTTYDNAYDKAAIAAYKTSSEVDIITESARLRDEYRNDPEGMANAFKAWDKGVRDTLDPELYQVWSGVQQAYYKNNLSKAITGKQQADFEANVATVLTGLGTRATELQDASFEGNDEKAALIFNSMKGEIENYANPSDGSQPVISEADAIKFIAKLTNQNHSNMFLGELSRTLGQPDGLEKGQEAIDKFRNSKVGDKELGMSKQEMLAKMLSLYGQEVRIRRNKGLLAKGQDKAVIASAEKHTKAVVASLNKGLPVTKEDIKAAEDGFRHLDPVKQQEYIDAIVRVGDIHDFLLQSPTDRTNTLSQLPLEDRQLYRKASDNFESELKDSGVEFLDRFFGQEFQPIDLADPDPDAIDGRLQKVEYYKQTLNRPVQLLTPSESGVIEREFDRLMDGEQYTKVVDKTVAVNLIFGDSSMEVWEQIADKSVGGVYTVIGDLARTNSGQETAHKVLRGMALQSSQGKTIKNLEQTVRTVIGNAFGDYQKLAQSYSQAAQALVVLRDHSSPIDDAVNHESDITSLVTQVTGDIYDVGTLQFDDGSAYQSKIILPQGWSSEAFEDFLDEPPLWVTDQMDSRYGSSQHKRDILQDAILVPEGHGRYYIHSKGKGGGLVTIKDQAGQAMILDINDRWKIKQ